MNPRPLVIYSLSRFPVLTSPPLACTLACAQNSERDSYLSPLESQHSDAMFPLCTGLFNVDAHGKCSFPSDQISNLMDAVWAIGYGAAAEDLDEDDQASLELLAFAVLLFFDFKYDVKRRVGAPRADDIERLMLRDFDVMLGEIPQVTNWIANANFCPSE